MKQIVITGAAGFIGSNLARRLNKNGFNNLILVDSFDNANKRENYEGIACSQKIERTEFVEWFKQNSSAIEFVFHLGARTDTTEFDFGVLDSLNLTYSKLLWEVCTAQQIPILYASSAATYGMGENGFSDNHSLIKSLKPLNPYGLSKQLFDLFVIEQEQFPPFWCGLKFFNVYGLYESHKGRMASVILHAYKQICSTRKVKLFKSHNSRYRDGEQVRDFIYVDDVVDICLYFFSEYNSHKNLSGIYNVGTGIARTFNDLTKAIFSSLNLPVQIEYIPIPLDIRDKYQYYTKADISKLKLAGFEKTMNTLEEGVEKYCYYLRKK